MYELVAILSMSWPKYSGKFGYPIPRVDDVPDYGFVYFTEGFLWNGKRGELRKELIQFIINALTYRVKRIEMITIEMNNIHLMDARMQVLSMLSIYQDDGFGNGILLGYDSLEMNRIHLDSDEGY